MGAGRGASGGRGRLRAGLLIAIGVLYALSIPWYRGEGAPATWLGLPDWVAVAIGCYAAVAILNAVAWLLTDVPDAPEAPEGKDVPASRASDEGGAQR